MSELNAWFFPHWAFFSQVLFLLGHGKFILPAAQHRTFVCPFSPQIGFQTISRSPLQQYSEASHFSCRYPQPSHVITSAGSQRLLTSLPLLPLCPQPIFSTTTIVILLKVTSDVFLPRKTFQWLSVSRRKSCKSLQWQSSFSLLGPPLPLWICLAAAPSLL